MGKLIAGLMALAMALSSATAVACSAEKAKDGKALVGETGAGKTTIIKLLTRSHDPTAGASAWTALTCGQ